MKKEEKSNFSILTQDELLEISGGDKPIEVGPINDNKGNPGVGVSIHK